MEMRRRPDVELHVDLKRRIAVLIADDEPLVRAALAESIGSDPAFELVGTAADADDAIRLARVFSPDVALVDVRMPGGGQRAVRGILEGSPRTRVVALSGSDDSATVLEMLQAGAASYVVKGDPGAILETIVRAAGGQSILSAEIAGGVIHELATHVARRDLEEREARSLRERIRRVIDEERFTPVFQPIVELATGTTAGFEALSRFRDEPVQSPDRWFADASSVGLRTELELAAASAAVARFREAPVDGYLSLNLSPETLSSSSELVGRLTGDRVVIEITEHAAIEDYDALAPALAALRADGARVAVDDAGAGFASMRHALQLSPDFIKLDISLTRGIDGDPRRRALAVGLAGFASELGAAVIAEGIETAAELETLRALGVAYGQGYFIGRPGPARLTYKGH
jgi:EAL domain-containing protein (putative c-di-GMP-specific phosphodiesterase class I)/DNA-binding NarL/FixJ family response regulator